MATTFAEEKKLGLVVAGVNGRMGRTTLSAIVSNNNIVLKGAFGRPNASYAGKSVADLWSGNNGQTDQKIGVSFQNVMVSNDLNSCLSSLSCPPDVLIDFTDSQSAVQHAVVALGKGIKTIIGTSGITEKNLIELKAASQNAECGLLIVPNFSVGAVLLIHFAKQAVKFFDSAEIVETHKLGKIDAPSGTAMYTARVMGEEAIKSNKVFNQNKIKESELLTGARGGKLDSGIHVHSLRLPGILSKQDVYLAGEGELLTLRHESHSTKCFEQGIVLAIKSVSQLSSFALGLESIIEQFTG